jgi:hypothetical protein
MNTDTIAHCTYRPRRKRSGNPPRFQLTERDIEIIRLVECYRFLNSDHIRRLISGSGKNITNRLKALFEHGYLDRPECQYDTYRPGGGSKPIVYALANKGSQLLNEFEFNGGRSSWTQKNKNAGRPFLEHTLAIADFAIALERAVQNRDRVEMIAGNELLSTIPSETRELHKPYRLNVPVVHQGTRISIGIEPDYAFSLVLSEKNQKAFFLVEIDRGTMPVERYDLKQTSILRKLVTYQAMRKTNLHQKHFGWKNFRVLFVTTSAERVQNIIAAANNHHDTKASAMFLFTDKQTLYAGDFLDQHWIDSLGNKQKLLPSEQI